jgi:hypothetical protein
MIVKVITAHAVVGGTRMMHFELRELHRQLTDLTRSSRPVGIVSDAYISLHEEGAQEILDAFKVLRDYADLATSQARNYQEKYEALLTKEQD